MKNLLHRRSVRGTTNDAGHPLVDLRQVVKNYRTAAGDYPVLKGIDLEVGKGEFVAVIGKSGSGKTTLLNMITGIDRPTSGQVIVNQTPVHRLSEGQMAVWRGCPQWSSRLQTVSPKRWMDCNPPSKTPT